MILLIFEGKDDKVYFESIKRLFFPEKEETFVCTYKSNIYSLYNKLKAHDATNGQLEVDTVSVLKEILLEKGDDTLKEIREDEVSEIYLFFDYDFQDTRCPIEENNRKLQEMLSLFNDETGNGKLYINYPMVESLRYTKELPDSDYWKYTVTLQKCKETKFKRQVSDFSYYGSNDYLVVNNEKTVDLPKLKAAKMNWLHLVVMNISKSNYICNDKNELPKEMITQQKLFDNQLSKYIMEDECKVSILNSFPIFLFDYFGEKIVLGLVSSDL